MQGGCVEHCSGRKTPERKKKLKHTMTSHHLSLKSSNPSNDVKRSSRYADNRTGIGNMHQIAGDKEEGETEETTVDARHKKSTSLILLQASIQS